jgi:hypothetical protein
MVVPFGAAADDKGKPTTLPKFFIPTALLSKAQAAPNDPFSVIVQGDGSIDGVSATRTGTQISRLVDKGSDGPLSITPDVAAQTTGKIDFSNYQLWPYVTRRTGPATQARASRTQHPRSPSSTRASSLARSSTRSTSSTTPAWA